MAKFQSAALALKTRHSIILTQIEEDVKVRVNKYSRRPATLKLDIPVSTWSQGIKVYPVGSQTCSSMRGVRLNLQPSEMKAEPREGAGIGGGGSKQAWSKTRCGITGTEKASREWVFCYLTYFWQIHYRENKLGKKRDSESAEKEGEDRQKEKETRRNRGITGDGERLRWARIDQKPNE